MSLHSRLACAVLALGIAAPATGAIAKTDTGGTAFGAGTKAKAARGPAELPPGSRAKVGRSGLAAAPADAPQVVKNIIAAGNRIADKPYVYGGGHGSWKSVGYDCSGSVSYALHGGRLVKSPMPSGSYTGWGRAGYGKWVTIFANGGHMYMVVAGLRFDTSGASSTGSRWQSAKRSPRGYTIRHPAGL